MIHFKGELRNIHKLRHWKLADVLHDKYGLQRTDADFMSSFLLPMLDLNPDKRASARLSLNHQWLQIDSYSSEGTSGSGTLTRSLENNGTSKAINKSDAEETIRDKEKGKGVKEESRKSEGVERRHSGYYK